MKLDIITTLITALKIVLPTYTYMQARQTSHTPEPKRPFITIDVLDIERKNVKADTWTTDKFVGPAIDQLNVQLIRNTYVANVVVGIFSDDCVFDAERITTMSSVEDFIKVFVDNSMNLLAIDTLPVDTEIYGADWQYISLLNVKIVVNRQIGHYVYRIDETEQTNTT